MSEPVPPTHKVREKYATVLDDTAGWKWSAEWAADFDRWLRQHDAEVRLAELDALDAEFDDVCCGNYNPVACETCRARELVKDRAARIRAEAQR